jgi:hypothetical protein
MAEIAFSAFTGFPLPGDNREANLVPVATVGYG